MKKDGTMTTADVIKAAVRRDGKALDVIPVRTGHDWIEADASVGSARSYAAALRLVKKAGYTILWVGGLHEIDPEGRICITVYP